MDVGKLEEASRQRRENEVGTVLHDLTLD
jgi:hypothetical protein